MPRVLLILLTPLLFHLQAAEPSAGGKGFNMDYGPFLAYTVNCRNYATNGVDNLALKGVAIRLAADQQAAVCFDTELLRYAAGWTGGFLDISNTHLTSYKGSREAFIAGQMHFQTRPLPGCSPTEQLLDPRIVPAGLLPPEWGRWKGLYRHGSNAVLHYSIGISDVHEIPGCETVDGVTIFTRAMKLKPTARPLQIVLCDVDPAAGELPLDDSRALGASGANNTFAMAIGAPPGANLVLKDGRIVFKLPASGQPTHFKLAVWSMPSSSAPAPIIAAVGEMQSSVDSQSLCGGGPPMWPKSIVTKGRTGAGRGAYVVDSIALPEQNPWRSWLRLVAFDFFADGRAAVSTWNGDVWVVSGIDSGLQNVAWKRFAAGLHEPLGLKVVDDVVHVLGRDGITRLRDLNDDGEADFYENFNNDVPISPSYHAFAMDLGTDRAGNFYHARCGQRIDPALPLNGGIVRISKDGSMAELIATGLRAANGLGIGPNDEIVCSDNQGNWIPASRINRIEPGRFYGYTPHARLPVVPTDYDKPICWMPVTVDNSSGSQAWITSDAWGPLKGKIIHTSYGKASLFLLMTEDVEGQWQGGVFQFPLKFDSGIMRARFHPRDGQLYVCGLKGWQTTGARDGCLQRVRYTGQPLRMPAEIHVKAHGIELAFTTALDRESVTDPQNWAVQHWNYRWTEAYGSDDYSVLDPRKKGRDDLEIGAVELASDQKRVLLKLPKLQPVMQMRVQFRVKAADGEPVSGEIHNTVNRVPKS